MILASDCNKFFSASLDAKISADFFEISNSFMSSSISSKQKKKKKKKKEEMTPAKKKICDG